RVALGVCGQGGDRQLPPLWHGVARVDDQVQDHLLELSHVPLDAWQGLDEIEAQMYLLVEHALNHVLDVADDLVQVELLGAQGLPAAEAQQLACDRASSLGCLEQLLYVPDELAVLGEPLANQLTVALDHGEEVVEI